MAFTEKNGLRYFTFNNFPETITHAIFTRQGGVSPAPWDSLNMGGTVGDDSANVRANRIRAFTALGRDPESLFDVWQVHGINVAFGDHPRDWNIPETKADIIFTDNPKVTLFMRFADCTPLLFHDASRGVVGLAHAGWMGTVQGVATAAVKAMGERYGSLPKDIHAAIGPSIGVDHYEVGENVVSQVRENFGVEAEALLPENSSSKRHFDLWKANHLQLKQVGVKQVEVAELCTVCHPTDWFSHRGENGKTGRFGALIALKEEE